MIDFKFLQSKRPILDSLLTEEEITNIREYCVDIANGNTDDLLKYYHSIGIIEKSFLDGVLRRIAINFYPVSHELSRIHMEIDVSTYGIFYVFTERYMDVTYLTHRDTITYHYLNEEL